MEGGVRGGRVAALSEPDSAAYSSRVQEIYLSIPIDYPSAERDKVASQAGFDPFGVICGDENTANPSESAANGEGYRNGVSAPEGFARALFFPGYRNETVDAEYRKFLDLQMLQEKPVGALVLVSLWLFSNISRYLSSVDTGVILASAFGVAMLICSIFSSLMSVLYAFSYIFPPSRHGTTQLQELRIRNWFLRGGIISFNLAHCIQLVHISGGDLCEDLQQQLYCARPNTISTPLLLGLLCMFYYSFLLSKNLTYFIIMGVGIMNSVALIACAFLVSVGRPGTRLTLGVIFLCFVMLGITHHMSSQYLTSFEYYMAYRRSVLSEADRTTEMARREREHLRMVLANVAHDLKTPLQAFDAGIHTIRSLVEENVPSNVFFGATARDVLNAVDASCAFMTMQINRALDVSKIQSHVKLMPKYESVNIESIVRWAVDTMSCIQNRIEIDVTYSQWPSHFRNVITDKVWFQENLLCLLSNAVKYSNDDSAVQLNLRIDEPPSESRRNSLNSSPNREANLADGNTFHLLTVEVIDSGIGVPEDRRHFLFKPFSQTQRCAGGTGLGLYSLALRVHRLGGSYGMRPRENGGSVFYFSILVKEDLTVSPTSSDSSNLPQPLLAQSIDEDHPADRTKTPSQTISWRQRSLEKGAAETEITFLTSGSADPLPLRSEGAQPRLRAAIASRCPLVLVVDDAPTALKMVQKALVQAGAEVNTATNGFTALKMMKSNLYTLVIMDIQMPVMDGFEAVRQLRAWERGPQGGGMHQYIIGASASPPGDDTSKYAIDVGMDEFCAKPFVFHDLVQKVRMLHASDGGGCCQ